MRLRIRSLPVRGLLAALATTVLLRVAGPGVRSLALVEAVELVANLLIVGTVGYLLFSGLAWLNRLLLWRIRRKLILSYILIGLIPVLLIVTMFLLAGTLSLLSVSSFLVKLSLEDLAREATSVATAAAGELVQPSSAGVREALERHHRALEARGLTAAVAFIPRGDRQAGSEAVFAGTWDGSRPREIPAWLVGEDFEGLVGVDSDRGLRMVARAAQPVGAAGVVIVDVPIDETAAGRLRENIGAELQSGSVVALDDDADRRLLDAEPVVTPGRSALVSTGGLEWFTFLEYADWASGEPRYLTLQIRVSPAAYYQRVFGAQARIGDVSLGYALLVALAAIGGLFLIIEAAAFVLGFALAKSITGAVHSLFVGTQHVQQGDFTHRIDVRAKDQLGELANSFNAMTSSVQDLLEQAATKKRLEEELRIARQVQMSLLPHTKVFLPGLDIAATCLPAREVGGDYYEFVSLGPRRLGVLVADVSGKGTSAAFYMAELKGVVLSLSQAYPSPRRLLVEVNRIMTTTIDSRSFVTMLYAVIDLARRTVTYARAGHTPLIHAAGNGLASQVEVLTPSGLVVGFDGLEQQFEDLLVEESRAVGDGDAIVLYTDGVTEAMNSRDEFFGEGRLTRLVGQHRGCASDAIQTRILDDVQDFVGAAGQHDDMTVVVLKLTDGE